MAKRTLNSKKEALERAQREYDEARRKEAGRIGAIAVDAGLDEVDVSDRELRGAFEEVVARFRGSASRSSHEDHSSSHPSADE